MEGLLTWKNFDTEKIIFEETKKVKGLCSIEGAVGHQGPGVELQ